MPLLSLLLGDASAVVVVVATDNAVAAGVVATVAIVGAVVAIAVAANADGAVVVRDVGVPGGADDAVADGAFSTGVACRAVGVTDGARGVLAVDDSVADDEGGTALTTVAAIRLAWTANDDGTGFC